MASLIYSAICSLDGYIEDADGNFDWAVPDDEVFTFISEQERPVGTYLYGRSMYETMVGWETEPALAEHSPLMGDFAQIWQAAEKIVYSSTLESASTVRTRIERTFVPSAVQELKDASPTDISVAGPNLAAHAFKAGLVDECRLFLVPIVIGHGKAALPTSMRVPLELFDERQFDGGFVYLAYRVRT